MYINLQVKDYICEYIPLDSISTLTDQSGLRTYNKVVLFKEKGSVSFVVF